MVTDSSMPETTRIPWEHPRLAGLYPHSANGGTYLCAVGTGTTLGVVWGDGSGVWYERVEGPASVAEVAEMDGPVGWEKAGKRVHIERDPAGRWYWTVSP